MADLTTFLPRWTLTLGAMLQRPIRVRSQCCRCGLQLRVDVGSLAMCLGPSGTLVNRLDRCSVVGCHGEIFYLASVTYGRQWLRLATDPELIVGLDRASPAQTAVSIGRLKIRGQ